MQPAPPATCGSGRGAEPASVRAGGAEADVVGDRVGRAVVVLGHVGRGNAPTAGAVAVERARVRRVEAVPRAALGAAEAAGALLVLLGVRGAGGGDRVEEVQDLQDDGVRRDQRRRSAGVPHSV
jgi:hypothetical protein